MTGENIGNLLNAKHVTWGWFQGGFAPTSHNSGGAVCGATSENIAGSALQEYTPHWNPFQYNATTANPAHWRRRRRPRSAAPTRPTTSTTCRTSTRR